MSMNRRLRVLTILCVKSAGTVQWQSLQMHSHPYSKFVFLSCIQLESKKYDAAWTPQSLEPACPVPLI